MSILDRIGDRVGDFLEEVMLPEEINTLHNRARRAMERDDYEQALLHLGEAEHRRPNTERTRRMRALCYFYLDDIDRAVELFDQALDIRESAAAHFYLGLCHEKMGHRSEAAAHFRRALQLDEDPPFAYDLHFGLGRVHLDQDRPDKAARQLRKALRIWPEQTDAALMLAEALRRRGEFDEARDTIHSAIGDTPDRQALLTLGRIEADCHNVDEASIAFEQLLERDPDDREALLGAARAHLAAGRASRANQHLIRALDDSEEDAEIFALIGETNERIDNPHKALESYESALTRDPDHEEANLGAARTALQLGQVESAAQRFAQLVDTSDTDRRAQALLGLGRCRLQMDDPVGARHLLEEADQLHRTRPPQLLHALGSVALRSDDPAEALVAFRRALDADPNAELRERLQQDTDRALQALRPDWKRPQSVESTADLVAALTGLRDHFRGEPRLEQVLPRVHQLLDTLDSPLSVAILGEFNSGKSTLVNALLGEKVVPMGVLPTTAHPCVMGYGPRKGARIVYEDGRLEDVDFATAQQKMKDVPEEIARLDYSYPHPELRSLNYLDTPGFNALDERHEQLAAQTLEEAEAILWLLDANQALTETEFSRLRSIPESDSRVILLVNKIDRFGDPDQRQDDVDEILEYLEDNAGDQVLDILAISALEALQARTGDGDEETTGDFERLLQLLDEQFVQRSWQIKAGEVSRGLDALLDDVAEIRNDEMAMFDELIGGADELLETIDEMASAPRSEASEHALTLEDRFDFVTLGIEREIGDALRRRGQIFSRVVLEPDDRAFILELLEERLADVIERAEREVLRETADLESELAARLSPLFASLSVTDARALRRRLEGFFDETRALKTVLRERVFGRWRARTEGRLAAGGDTTLDAIIELGEDAPAEQRREKLAELIPRIGDEFTDALAAWYEEFFLAAQRFCHRLRRDLTTLQLEAKYRLDFDE